jgi:hypothetical protein
MSRRTRLQAPTMGPVIVLVVTFVSPQQSGNRCWRSSGSPWVGAGSRVLQILAPAQAETLVHLGANREGSG